MNQKITLLIFFIVMLSYGQKPETLSGDIKNLKGITEFSVVFDYSNLQIPNVKSEEEFLAKKMAIREKKLKGSGEVFKQKWFSNRKEYYEPKFIESFNKWFNKDNAISEKAGYTINIHVVKLFPGYNVFGANQYAKLWAHVTVYAKDNPEEILFRGAYDYIKGGKTYEEHERVSRCFFNLAKNLSLYIKRKAK